MRKELRDGGIGVWRKRDEKRIKICCVPVPTSHDECNLWELQRCTSKNNSYDKRIVGIEMKDDSNLRQVKAK